MNGNTVIKEILIEESGHCRKEITNTLHKGALRDTA